MENADLAEAVRTCVEHCSAHLIDLVVRGTRANAVVEVFVDTDSGVTTDLCSAISREIARVFDHSGWFPGAYRLEVSSPGIDRPLQYPWQYRKHIGRSLGVRTRNSPGPERRSCRLAAVHDDGIVVVGEGETQEELIPFEDLTEAVVRSPW
jgi:ribosome maturation factor RimP